MKPEPLTKEKIKEEVLNRIKSKYDKSIYEPIILFDSCDVIVDELFDIIKQRLNWILKEIEKEIWKHEKTAESFLNEGNTQAKEWHSGISEGLEIAKDLIKKAFEGM